MGECRDKANCAVPAHSEISNVIEKDYGCGGVWVDGFAEERANDNLRSTRFTDDSAPERIEFAPEAIQAA
jgi:hypothetical protein